MIDPSLGDWSSYFNGFVPREGGTLYTPEQGSLMAGAMERFVDWFRLPVRTEADLAIADDCKASFTFPWVTVSVSVCLWLSVCLCACVCL